jgi:hypothetical protein
MSVASVELLRAAASGDLNRVRALLVQGVDVNSTNKANQTALMLAAAFKRIEIVKYLVLAGADVKLQDELGLTALDWARQDTRITQLLNDAPLSVAPQRPLIHTSHQVGTTNDSRKLGGLAGAILRSHTTVSSAFAAAVAREVPVSAEPLSVGDQETVDETLKRPRPELAPELTPDLTNATVAPADPVRAPTRIVEPTSVSDRVDIPVPPVSPTSSAVRTLFRAGIVVLLLVGAFLNYHLVTSVLSTLTSLVVKQEPAPLPVNAATKSAPLVSGELAGAQLFLPDAVYPRDATVANGNVTVGIQVSRKGIVVKAKALDGDESLRSAAEKAALSAAFDPEKLPDKSSLIDGTITYNFLKPADSGFIADAITPNNVSATAGGPLAGAERKLVIPKIPKSVRVEQESATVVVRVNRAGRVMSCRPLVSEGRFRAYLIKAARASTFDPAKLSSEGQVVGIITYKFQ